MALGCEQYQLVLEVKPQEALHFGHELPPPPAPYQVQVSARNETNMTMGSSITRTNSTKYEGKFILTISNFAETLATFALKGEGHSRNDVFFEIANRKITLI